MTYNIIHVNGHYEVYINGIFYCSADTINAAAKEIEEYEEDTTRIRNYVRRHNNEY